MDNWKFSSPQAWSPCTTIPQDCSPIALTNCLYKLLGRLNNIYLMWYLEYSFTKSVWFLSWPKHSWFSSLFWDSNHSSICMLWFSISCPFFYLEKAYQVVATYLSTTIIPKHGYFHKVLSFWVHLLCQIYLFYFFFFPSIWRCPARQCDQHQIIPGWISFSSTTRNLVINEHGWSSHLGLWSFQRHV